MGRAIQIQYVKFILPKEIGRNFVCIQDSSFVEGELKEKDAERGAGKL